MQWWSCTRRAPFMYIARHGQTLLHVNELISSAPNVNNIRRPLQGPPGCGGRNESTIYNCIFEFPSTCTCSLQFRGFVYMTFASCIFILHFTVCYLPIVVCRLQFRAPWTGIFTFPWPRALDSGISLADLENRYFSNMTLRPKKSERRAPGYPKSIQKGVKKRVGSHPVHKNMKK